MIELLLIIVLVLLIALCVMSILLLRRRVELADALTPAVDNITRELSRVEQRVATESEQTRKVGRDDGKQQRDELNASLKRHGDSTNDTLDRMAHLQKLRLDEVGQRLEKLTTANESKLETLRQQVDKRLTELQSGNEKKLDQMRQTVDEKLQKTLDRRLGESFTLVSKRLEAVQHGLGEMQELAGQVGDLKRVMTNVKSRGTWGEYVLSNLLEEALTPEQYERNAKVRPRSDVQVEFAIKLPGSADDGTPVWLPIDSKFPREEHERIEDAMRNADADAAEKARKALEVAVLKSARDIRDKYIAPPYTTDFAVLFLPTESLYAELLSRPGLVDRLQRDCRVNLAGPSTLLALLNSLQMGFRTLAIQKRSSEVWKLLGGVKTEFGRFEKWIDAVNKKLDAARKEMDEAGKRTRQMNRKLSKVEELPSNESQGLLGLADTEEEAPENNTKA
ncbi:MAG: DNA recombination protein RmuC [Planctomycetota bacterium]